MGPKGPMGPMSPMGPKGPMDPKGPKGPMSPKGPMGPEGRNSGACMSQNATIYSILEHACPKMILFTAFWSTHVPKCYYLHAIIRFGNSSADSADSAETVSAAAEQTHPNHAQES